MCWVTSLRERSRWHQMTWLAPRDHLHTVQPPQFASVADGEVSTPSVGTSKKKSHNRGGSPCCVSKLTSFQGAQIQNG
jgi:hypothetical protein